MKGKKQLFRSSFTVLLLAILTFSFTGSAFAENRGPEGELEYWSEDSEVAASIMEFVAAAVDEDSEGYIPEEDRIAVFDLDGTIIGELYPSYFEYMMFIHRALYDEDFTPSDGMKEFAQALEEGIKTGDMPENHERLHARYAGEAYAGMTMDEMKAYTKAFMKSKADGFENLTRGEAFYKPMVSLVNYLNDNDFTVFVVSGSDRVLIRGMIENVLPVPSDRIIGMSYNIEAKKQDGEDGLEYVYAPDDEVIRGRDLIIKTIKMNKVSVIAQEIGKVPVLSFGNSSGDVSMAQYTINNKKYAGQAYMLCCDDLEREHGNMKKADAMKETCQEKGFIPVSMRDDFATIYGDDVTVTDYEYDEASALEDIESDEAEEPEEDPEETAKEDTFVEKEVPVFKKELTDDKISLRFYDKTPNIPYIGIKEFYDYVMKDSLDDRKETMTVTKEEDGTYTLESGHGKAGVDVDRDIVSSEDMMDFRNIMCLTQKGIDSCYCDGLPYVRVSEVKTDGRDMERLNLGLYDIDIYGDDEDVYFPVPTLSAIFSDLVYHFVAYNGENFYFNTDSSYVDFTGVDPDYAKPILEGLGRDLKRPEDLIEYGFNEICFVVDNYYGLPGRAILNDEIKKKGLERALKDYGEAGEKTIELLKSENFAEYLFGFRMLQYFVNDGGHTRTDDMEFGDADMEEIKEETDKLAEEYESLFAGVKKESEERNTGYDGYFAKKKMRDDAYKGETYIKEGDTVVFVLDSFMGFDMQELKDYYESDDENLKADSETLKNDDMVYFSECIADAEDDPEIKNFVVDCSNNIGGSLDEVAMLYCLVTGKRELSVTMENALSGVKTTQTYEADTNFDRVFDEKDENERRLNYAVLTSGNSFSCGNIFPSVMKDDGYMILGERSGGGACAIEIVTSGEGIPFRMSTYSARILDDENEVIDAGIPVDSDLVIKRSDGKDKVITVLYDYEDEEGKKQTAELRSPDYSEFYDISRLSDEVNEFYE